MPLYLVTMNLNRADPLLSVDQLTQFIRSAISLPWSRLRNCKHR
jgi:hypothetical protein